MPRKSQEGGNGVYREPKTRILKPQEPKIKLPARASAWYLLSSGVTKGVGFIVTPIFTRLISGEAYGKIILYMTLLGGASLICSAFNSGSAIYRGLQLSEGEQESFLRAALTLSVCVSSLISLLLFTFSPFLELKRVFYIPLSLQLLCDGIIGIMMSRARFYYKYKTVVAVNLISSVLPAIITVWALKTRDFGYPVRIYSLLFVSICIAAFSLWWILSRGKAEPGRRKIKTAFKFALPLLPHSVSSAVTSQADKIIISSVMGAGALAKYSVVYSMGSVLQFVVTAVGSALSPWIIRRLRAEEQRKISELIAPMTLGYCALSLCLVGAAPEVLRILAPEEYFDALPALLPIALSTPFYFISTVATVGIAYSGRIKESVFISLSDAVLCIILNYMLIGRLGYFGAGLSLLICQTVNASLGIALLPKEIGHRMIGIKKTAMAILLSIPVGIVISELRESLIGRGIMLIIPAFMLIYCLIKAKELVLEKGRKIGA